MMINTDLRTDLEWAAIEAVDLFEKRCDELGIRLSDPQKEILICSLRNDAIDVVLEGA